MQEAETQYLVVWEWFANQIAYFLSAPFNVTLISPCTLLKISQQHLILVVTHYDRMYAVMI